MSSRTLQLSDTLYDYILSVSVRESDVLARLHAETAKLPQAGMQISPEHGQFMALIVELTGARRCIEVGTFTGYSALCIAGAMPPGGTLIACDVSEEWTSIGQRFWREAGVEDRIDLRLGPATETLQALIDGGEAGRFDLVFIDADKQNYDAYYEAALRLLRPGGLVMIDNVLWGGSVAKPDDLRPDPVALRTLNAKIHGDDRVGISLVPIGDGLTLARKRA